MVERSYKRDEAENYRPRVKGTGNEGPRQWLSHVGEVKLGWQSFTALAQEEKRARNGSRPGSWEKKCGQQSRKRAWHWPALSFPLAHLSLPARSNGFRSLRQGPTNRFCAGRGTSISSVHQAENSNKRRSTTPTVLLFSNLYKL